MKLPKHLALVPCIVLSGCLPVAAPSGGRQPASYSQQVGRRAATPQPPVLKRLDNGHYRVAKPWTVELGGRKWQVQKGYKSNGITAPDRIKASLGDGVDNPETWAAVFHDWLFTQPGVSRAEADSTFHKLLLAYGVSPSKADLMHATVKAYSLTKGLR